MKYSEFNITLDIHDVNPQTTIRVKKGDTCRRINVTLSEKGEPYSIAEDCTAVFTGVKPDGNKLFNPCEILGDTIRYDLTEQTTIVAGLVKAEVRLMGSDNEELTTPSFYIIVDDTLYTDGDLIASTPEGFALKRFADLIGDTEEKLANGEFDGFSPTVEVVPFDGGTEVIITDRNGEHSFRVLNSEGAGTNGKDGVGVASVEQTTTSTEDGGTNVITVTLTNGTTATFSVLNGSKGSKGDRGERGVDGASGSDGKDGVTPAFSIGTVTTLASGSNATASISGTTENPVLNLGIPKGDRGEDGDDASVPSDVLTLIQLKAMFQFENGTLHITM